jgi:hypothetical protein
MMIHTRRTRTQNRYRRRGSALEGTLKLLSAATRKSGLTREQIDRQQWAISFDELLKIEWHRIDELNEVNNKFFGREMAGNTPAGAQE